MVAKEYAILSTWSDSSPNDIGNGYIREFIKNGVTFIDHEESYLKYGNKKAREFISNTIDENSIKVLVYQPGPSDFHFSLDFFQSLREKVFTVMMIGDPAYYFYTKDIYYAQAMDLVVVYDYSSRYKFEQYGIEAISFYSSYDKSKYFKMDNIKKDIDLSFVGHMLIEKGRTKNIEHIIRNGFDVQVFGIGSKNGQISLEEMVKIFNRTKINLNFTGIGQWNALRKEPNINLRTKQIKGRMTEINMCGGFVLSEYVPGIEEVFELDEEIVVFHSKGEMIEKIKYYLEHDGQREAIANNGYIRALKDYEISTAIPRLINKIEEYRKLKIHKPAQLYLDKDFIKYYTTFRVLMMVRFAKSRNWGGFFEELHIILKNKKLDMRRTLKYLLDLFPGFKELLKRIFYFRERRQTSQDWGLRQLPVKRDKHI